MWICLIIVLLGFLVRLPLRVLVRLRLLSTLRLNLKLKRRIPGIEFQLRGTAGACLHPLGLGGNSLQSCNLSKKKKKSTILYWMGTMKLPFEEVFLCAKGSANGTSLGWQNLFRPWESIPRRMEEGIGAAEICWLWRWCKWKMRFRRRASKGPRRKLSICCT